MKPSATIPPLVRALTFVVVALLAGCAGATSGDPDDLSGGDDEAPAVATDALSRAVIVTAASGLFTTEAGGTATFTIKLETRPTASVTVQLASSDPSAGTVSPSSVTFTRDNWKRVRTITVTGVRDSIADGDRTYSIVTAPAISADPRYSGFNPPDVALANLDDDRAGITVSATGPQLTSEAGGTATFTVRLDSQPTGAVTIPLTSSNVNEGTLGVSSLTFTTTNWYKPQSVTVTGVNDQIADGDRAYSIVTAPAISIDPGYAGLNAADVAVINTDNDSAGIFVSPTSTAVTTESGGRAVFTIRLNSQPTANVTIPLTSTNAREGVVSAASITFNAANWRSPQTVTVTGVDDALDDGSVHYMLVTGRAISADPRYSGLDAVDLTLVNLDDDGP